jgi:CheY-like chemotaxis protein
MAYSPEYKKQVLAVVNGVIKNTDELKERSIIEKLGQQVSRIVSASRIEGNDDIASFATVISNLIVALASGRLLPDENIRSLLLDSLNQIRENVEGNRVGIEPALLSKLKSILNGANSSERDYMVFKTIKVMYIDDDDFVYHTVCKLAGNSIELKLVPNESEARQLLSQEKFDAILCEIDLPDINGLELIKEFSSRYPVIAISASDDSRRIQLATKAGATDFVVKNEIGIRLVPRSLHSAVIERERKTRAMQKNEIIKDPRTVRVLTYLMNDSVIEQELKPASFYKMQLPEPEMSLSKTLNALEQAGYIIKNIKRLTPSCPRCRSINLVSSFFCAHCNKSNFVRGDIIEHNRCGHNDLEFAFQKNGSNDHLVCPKCNKELKLIGVDYLRTEAAYKCKECSNIFASPEQRLTCSECDNSSFRVSEAGWKPLYSYTINPEKVPELRKKTISLSPIMDYLSSKGFSVSLDSYVNTRIQNFGPFELVARKGEELTLAIIVLGDDIEANHSKIIELDTMSRMNASTDTVYAITFTDLREVTRDLLSKFGITAIVLKNSDQLLSRIKEHV